MTTPQAPMQPPRAGPPPAPGQAPKWPGSTEQTSPAGLKPSKRRWLPDGRWLPWVVAVLALFMGIGIGSTGSGDQTAELDTASGQVAVLESDLAQAEDQNASLEDSLAEAEASLAEAGESLASGDDAAAALDAREEELNAREDALDEREKALDDREANADSQPDAPAPAPPPPAEDSGSDLTAGQENAIRSAVSYLEMSGFSRAGLIDQLKFEGYSAEDATVAVDSLNVDWKEQAARSAESYLEMSGFSRSGLIDQLKFEGYTQEQAEYGVTKAGL